MKTHAKEAKKQRPMSELVAVKSGSYSDGHPLDTVHYWECKVILRGERFTSVQNFRDFGKLVRKTAQRCGVGFDTSEFVGRKPQMREVLFLDTHDFKLYNNAFILRRRTNYVDGFLVGDPEVVFKFRHTDLQTAAETDVRPRLPVDYRVKFKAEALPLKDKLGGHRLLYSHNVEFPLSAVQSPLVPKTLENVVRILPALKVLQTDESEHIDFVNHVAVTELLLDIGILDFGKGVEPKSSVSLWRTRGDFKQLVGEFSFQWKFQRNNELHNETIARCLKFLGELQNTASDWVELGVTKTAAVYRLHGNQPHCHE
jgi:hypothetical protein